MINRRDAERRERINYNQYRQLLDKDASGAMINQKLIVRARKSWKLSRSILAAKNLEAM